jgi:hypothetical protein
MHFPNKLHTNERAVRLSRKAESVANRVVRKADAARARAGLGGRKAAYDDASYEFVGGAGETLRRRHYDKSLRLLWKAEAHAPWLGFEDCSKEERALLQMAQESMKPAEREALDRITQDEFRDMLKREYSQRERQAIVNVLTAIGHGEAYAWLVSAELLGQVQSTGARTALTMQVLEEAKHFVVLRALLRSFDVPIPRQSAWEYLLLENVLKLEGLEKLFGMNVLVEGIALSFFGLLAGAPGLEILQMFHLDEARHAALPSNYLAEFPMSDWAKKNPVARARRLKLVLPALCLMPHLEPDLNELGIDAYEFGGSVVSKISALAYRNGFYLPMPRWALLLALDAVFNGWCSATRQDHRWTSFTGFDSTKLEALRKVERKVFFGAA